MISEIRPILLIRPILGNVLFFVTGPRTLIVRYMKSDHLQKMTDPDPEF